MNDIFFYLRLTFILLDQTTNECTLDELLREYGKKFLWTVWQFSCSFGFQLLSYLNGLQQTMAASSCSIKPYDIVT